MTLLNTQRKQLLEDRKKELHLQQKANENEHLQILGTIAKHERVEFQQTLLQDRQAFEKALLQEVREGRREGGMAVRRGGGGGRREGGIEVRGGRKVFFHVQLFQLYSSLPVSSLPTSPLHSLVLTLSPLSLPLPLSLSLALTHRS